MPIKIFIDQGHNASGFNTGAEANGLREQDVNYNIGMYLADMLRHDPRFEVRTSRNSPTENLGSSNASSLQARVNMANSWPADYFISIHGNANNNPAINGTEAYIYRTGTQANWLAQHIVNSVVRDVGTFDNGVRTNPGLYVLKKTKMPAVLVETGYLTNTKDAELLRNKQMEFARGIYDGILTYFGMN